MLYNRHYFVLRSGSEEKLKWLRPAGTVGFSQLILMRSGSEVFQKNGFAGLEEKRNSFSCKAGAFL
jgi:hypothetical protein